MSSYLRSPRVSLKVLVLALIVALSLAACERPLQSVTDGDATPTAPAAPTDAAPTDADPTTLPPTGTPTAAPTEEEPLDEAEATEPPPATDESPRPGDEVDEGEEATAEPPAEATAEPPAEETAEATPEPTAAPTAAPTEAPAGSGEERVHTVQTGENLYRIGLQYGVSWTVLAEYNNIANPNSLVAGQQIRIPPATGDGDSAPPAGDISHVVQPGETLFIISQQYGVSWPDIAAANNLTAPYTIHVGQTLVIPGGQ